VSCSIALTNWISWRWESSSKVLQGLFFLSKQANANHQTKDSEILDEFDEVTTQH